MSPVNWRSRRNVTLSPAISTGWPWVTIWVATGSLVGPGLVQLDLHLAGP